MISCKSVATVLSSDELEGLPWWKRAEVRMHLLFCKYCSRFAQQLQQLRSAAKRTPASVESDPTLEKRLEEQIIRRLSGKGD